MAKVRDNEPEHHTMIGRVLELIVKEPVSCVIQGGTVSGTMWVPWRT